ncbi:SDR family NAD(P)-dependent oxidoreductase [Microlunatus parietis]|uniref:NAD(P)-dependent dehydrogenase (Short-subunit alcohol dehydrogenase family) n=1 Tax=Microlunatus parietis TaxID=682979 RepID=A0A7Y9ICL2_9ACTN|nr:SDR family oxidoreductase [Microlunatus parietis]NYE74345.1 NAD(P)-dependent dehydrogenase (short-subunit alcohol dehydrogenase family) [Microlunatus parietis]
MGTSLQADLTGRVALVTGGSRGIGAAIARALSAAGADVALTYERSRDLGEKVAAGLEERGGRGLALPADSADASAIQAAVDRTVAEFGRLDIVINNAGIFPYGPVEETDLAEIDRTIAVHVRAPFLAVRAAVPHLGRGARIITIGSNLAERAAFGGIALYVMSKAANLGLTRALARELGPRGITVNLIQPGSTETDMNPAVGDSADLQRGLMALGEYGSVDDIAAAVVFLAGGSARQITGATLTIDGGTNA